MVLSAHKSSKKTNRWQFLFSAQKIMQVCIVDLFAGKKDLLGLTGRRWILWLKQQQNAELPTYLNGEAKKWWLEYIGGGTLGSLFGSTWIVLNRLRDVFKRHQEKCNQQILDQLVNSTVAELSVNHRWPTGDLLCRAQPS